MSLLDAARRVSTQPDRFPDHALMLPAVRQELREAIERVQAGTPRKSDPLDLSVMEELAEDPDVTAADLLADLDARDQRQCATPVRRPARKTTTTGDH